MAEAVKVAAAIDRSIISGDLDLRKEGACRALLAKVHARTGQAALTAGYRGNSTRFDKALAERAEACGDQNDIDRAASVEAINSGRAKAVTGEEK